jgi:MFS family permease
VVKRPVHIDYLGSILLAAGVSSLLIWVSLAGQEFDWWSWQTWLMVGGGIALLALTVLAERTAPEPIIPLRFFANRTVALAALSSLFVGVGLFGGTVFLSQYFQLARGESPTMAGVMTIPLIAGLFFSSTISGQVISPELKGQVTSNGYLPFGNATALSQWSYCFDRNDTDTSRGDTAVGSGVGNNWNCSVTGSANEADPSWNAVAQKLMPASGAGVGVRGHAKTVEAIKWMRQNHGDQSYYVPAHLERAGMGHRDGPFGARILTAGVDRVDLQGDFGEGIVAAIELHDQLAQ